jgi:hypothetical protein
LFSNKKSLNYPAYSFRDASEELGFNKLCSYTAAMGTVVHKGNRAYVWHVEEDIFGLKA